MSACTARIISSEWTARILLDIVWGFKGRYWSRGWVGVKSPKWVERGKPVQGSWHGTEAGRLFESENSFLQFEEIAGFSKVGKLWEGKLLRCFRIVGDFRGRMQDASKTKRWIWGWEVEVKSLEMRGIQAGRGKILVLSVCEGRSGYLTTFWHFLGSSGRRLGMGSEVREITGRAKFNEIRQKDARWENFPWIFHKASVRAKCCSWSQWRCAKAEYTGDIGRRGFQVQRGGWERIPESGSNDAEFNWLIFITSGERIDRGR